MIEESTDTPDHATQPVGVRIIPKLRRKLAGSLIPDISFLVGALQL